MREIWANLVQFDDVYTRINTVLWIELHQIINKILRQAIWPLCAYTAQTIKAPARNSCGHLEFCYSEIGMNCGWWRLKTYDSCNNKYRCMILFYPLPMTRAIGSFMTHLVGIKLVGKKVIKQCQNKIVNLTMKSYFNM